MTEHKKHLKSILPKYTSNPSVGNLSLTTRKKKIFADSNKSLIITDKSTGEQTPAHAGATFIEETTVDTEQFIKLYSVGVKLLADLSTSGYKIFQLVYQLMLENPNKDKLVIEYNDLKNSGKYSQSQKTFIAGINELLSKEIIFQTTSPYMYFINVQLFFNGDRINIVKSYKLRKEKNKIDQDSIDLLTDLPEK